MDLRSIINTEAGDSSTDKQATPVTPIKVNTVESFGGYDHLLHASPPKHIPQEYGTQRTETSHAASIYQQNYQYRRPPSHPIQVSISTDIGSNSQSVSARSPLQTALSSGTSQFSFPPNQQTPESPAQSYQYKALAHKRDSSQFTNSSNIIENQETYIRSSPQPQTLTSTPGAIQVYGAHQRSDSSTTNPNSYHSHQNFINSNYSDPPSISGADYPSLHAQNQIQQVQSCLPVAPSGPQLAHRFSISNPPQSLDYAQKTSSGPPSQHLQISPTQSAPDSLSLLSRTSISYDQSARPLNEQHLRIQTESKNLSTSFSPKSRPTNLQKIELSSDSEKEHIGIPITKMDKELGSSKNEIGSSPIANKTESKITSSKINKNVQPSSTSLQHAAKKRIRYSEPPIWARSIKTHGAVILAHQNSVNSKEKNSAVEAISAPALPRTKSNGNITSATQNRTVANESHPSVLLGNWEESITGKKPIEHMTKVVADFIYLNVISRTDLGELSASGVQFEIEAKLGELIDKDTNQRYILPVMSECILAENLRVGFKSSMTEKQHQKLNEFLNEMVTRTHPGNPSAKSRVKIDYLHRREVDKFYELPKIIRAGLPAAINEQISSHFPARVRVTHDQRSGNVLAKIIKARVISLDIYSGVYGTLDCRISINLEMPYNQDIDELIAPGKSPNQNPDRSKDRLSYTQSYYQIDLTQVTQNLLVNNVPRTEKEHELEIEISTDAIIDHGRRAANGHPNEFLPLIEGFLNNVRVLSRIVNETRPV